MTPAFGEDIARRIDALAAISESTAEITRVYLSREHRLAGELLLSWMRDAGMTAHIDAVGNVRGRYEGVDAGLPCLLLGSHFDTVRNAGRWDGPLGIVTAIVCVADLYARHVRLPFAIEIVAFADEEGVRFASTLLGSRAVAGTFDESVLEARDDAGLTMHQAMLDFDLDPARIGLAARSAQDVLAYVELHIEQGPVLEKEALPVGLVTAIAGATRLRVTLRGMAGHAGTVPMGSRKDALACAAQCILAIEAHCRAEEGLVGTVGAIDARPGATNVIPGEVSFSIDVRAHADPLRQRAVAAIVVRIESIAAQRGIMSQIDVTHENKSVPCAGWLQEQIAHAIAAEGHRVFRLPSGAGHDGMAMIDLTDIGMIFVRCRGGVSHHPDEHVATSDADAGARVLMRLIANFGRPAAVRSAT